MGGVWDKLSTRTEQMKEGLSKFLAIMPYDVISLTTWNTVMPVWLDAICKQIPERDIPNLKVLLWYVLIIDNQ